MSELKPCPFCNSLAQDSDGCLIPEGFATCSNSECSISMLNVSLEEWNNRPYENTLKADAIREALNYVMETRTHSVVTTSSLELYADKLEKGEL